MRTWPGAIVLARCEAGAASLLTLGLVALHIRVLTHAGPLWRDEVNSLHIATASTWNEFSSALVFDFFPAFFAAVLRGWIALGFGHTDFGLRVLGFFMGVALLAALWVTCRLINKQWSLWPLVIFAMNPFVLYEGDSLRGYGLGLIWIVLVFGLVWRLTFAEPRPGIIILAALAAIFCVQTLYLNCLILLAICIGAVAVAIRRKNWRLAVLMIGLGLIAGLSLVPYLSILRKARELSALLSVGSSFSQVVGEYVFTLRDDNRSLVWVWICFCLLGLALAGRSFLRKRQTDARDQSSDELLFALTTLAIATLGTLTFVWHLGVPTTRYFLPLLAVSGLCVHLFAGKLHHHIRMRAANLVFAVMVAMGVYPSSYSWLNLRSTNCDLAAAAAAKYGEQSDLIVVTRFSFGVSFDRYYHGVTPWKSVPDVADHTQHRWDLVKDAMMKPDAMAELISQIESVLKSGHRVFLVGNLASASPPQLLAPAPQTTYGWKLFGYLDNWQREIAYLLEQHGAHGEQIAIDLNQPVNAREDLGVFVVSGWR
jgi:hypothetical protein